MTLKQFIEVNNLIEESYIYKTNNHKQIRTFVDRVCAYLNKGKRFADLKCFDLEYDYCNDYTLNDAKSDMEITRSYLHNAIDSIPNSSTIEKILDLNKQIVSTGEKDYNEMLSIIRQAFFAFDGSVLFDDNIKKLAAIPCNGAQAKEYCALDINVLNGLKTKLEAFADSLLSPMKSGMEKSSSTSIVVNNNNSNNNSQSMKSNVDIKNDIENIYESIEEASLSPSEEEQLKETVHKLEELLNSEESKSKKWNRFKEIVGGIAQFSLKAAEILAPLMMAAWPK